MRAAGAALAVALLIGLAPSVGLAQSGFESHEAGEDEAEAAPRPEAEARTPEPVPGLDGHDVGLDQLLRLPSDLDFERERRRGATAEQWRTRFESSRQELETAKRELRDARSKLDEMAGGGGGAQWKMAPPGSNQTEASPISFKLREDIRRGKEQVLEAERQQRALIIEADLAGVPETWRHGT